VSDSERCFLPSLLTLLLCIAFKINNFFYKSFKFRSMITNRVCKPIHAYNISNTYTMTCIMKPICYFFFISCFRKE
jgi:hypothetical protein